MSKNGKLSSARITAIRVGQLFMQYGRNANDKPAPGFVSFATIRKLSPTKKAGRLTSGFLQKVRYELEDMGLATIEQPSGRRGFVVIPIENFADVEAMPTRGVEFAQSEADLHEACGKIESFYEAQFTTDEEDEEAEEFTLSPVERKPSEAELAAIRERAVRETNARMDRERSQIAEELDELLKGYRLD